VRPRIAELWRRGVHARRIHRVVAHGAVLTTLVVNDHRHEAGFAKSAARFADGKLFLVVAKI